MYAQSFKAALTLSILLMAIGCSESQKAEDSLEDYLNAEIDGDRKEAYEHLSQKDKAKIDAERYLNDPSTAREDTSFTIVDVVLDGDKSAQAVVRVERRKPDGELHQHFEVYHLAKEGEHWRVRANWSGALSNSEEILARSIADYLDRHMKMQERLAHHAEDFMQLGKDLGKIFVEVAAREMLEDNRRDQGRRHDSKSPGSSKSTNTPSSDPFDAKPGDKPKAPKTNAAPSSAGWSLSKRRDPMTDHQTLLLQRRSPTNIMRPFDAHPTLFVRCTAGELSIFVDAKTHLDADGFDFQHSPVELRIGKQPAQIMRGRFAEHNRRMLFLPEPHALLAGALRSPEGEILIKLQIPMREPAIADFSLEGFDKAAAPLLKACAKPSK